jgi:hypothetical protein
MEFSEFPEIHSTQLMDTADIDVYVINNYFRDWGHQLIHNKSSLTRLMEYCGFENIKYESVGKSTDLMLAGLEHHGLMITEAYNKYETMVIEAAKPVKKIDD